MPRRSAVKNTPNSLTHQKMNANLLTRLPSFFMNPKSYKIYRGSLVSCSFILLNCASSSSFVSVLHGSPHTSATIFFFPSMLKNANLCVLLIFISLNKPLISASTWTPDIREFKIRRLRTTNYGWTSVVVCL